jgi:hypothetical protein
MHLEPSTAAPIVGNTFEVIRGNGPREGDHMGTATVKAIENGAPVLIVASSTACPSLAPVLPSRPQ